MFRLSLFVKKCTEYSNHYADWSRVGILLRTGHRYSSEELILRGKVAACMAISGFVSAHLNNPERTHCSDLTVGIAAAMFTLYLAHFTFPSYRKRVQISKECDELVAEIHQSLNQLTLTAECLTAIKDRLNAIATLSLSDEADGRATQTWVRRKNLLIELNEQLKPGNFDENFWVEKTNSLQFK